MPELKPLFRRYWVAILPDGSALSQFDLEGNYIQWSDDIPATKIMFLPFSLEFAAKVRAKGDLAEASNLQLVEFAVKQKHAAYLTNGARFFGSLPSLSIIPNITKYHRHVVYRQTNYTTCLFCGANLDDGATSCPRCLGMDWYYCDLCDSLKEMPIVKLELQTTGGLKKWIQIPYSLLSSALKVVHNLPIRWGIKNIQILCPDCTEPRGLMPVLCIMDQPEQTLSSTHVLEIDGQKHLIVDLVKT